MARYELVQLFDPKKPRTELDLGGTRRPFKLETTGGSGFLVTVQDDNGARAEIDVLYGPEVLFMASLSQCLTGSYDYEGTLIMLTFEIGRLFEKLPPEVKWDMEPETMELTRALVESGGEIFIEIDLRDGLASGDRGGWVQLIVGDEVEKEDEGIGGYELVDGKDAGLGSVTLGDNEVGWFGKVYFLIQSKDGVLSISIGGEKKMVTTKLYRQMNPNLIDLVKKPTGALRLLASLQPQKKG